MKNKMRIHPVLSMACALLLLSCGEDDSEKQWGYTKVYMPQAAILNGGLNNNYPVPLNNNVSTKNYEIDEKTNTLKIVLGVYRSGLQDLEPFSVDVKVDEAATATAVKDIPRGIELPEGTYSLPDKIQVQTGRREAIFYLSVNLDKLIADYPSYNKQKMVLVVGIDHPTKYELNEKLSRTTVIIDGKEFMPTPPVVNGGDFGAESETYWQGVVKNGSVQIGTDAGIRNGVLFFDYGPTSAVEEIYYFTEVELDEGMSYTFSCDFLSTGEGINTTTGCRFYLLLRQDDPRGGFTYKDDVNTFYTYLDAWNGMAAPIDGTLPQNGGWQERIDRSSGVFTSNFTGKGYLVIGAAGWNSPIGRIEIDNVKIIEK